MEEAIEAVKSKKLSYRQAATKYSVSKSGLCRAVNKSLFRPDANNAENNPRTF